MIHRLLYHSEVELVGSEAPGSARVRLIAEKSAARNAAAGLSGALLHSRGRFIQVLEGPVDPLEETFERICCDLRHRNVVLLEYTPTDDRIFAEWSMAQVEADATLGGLIGQLGFEGRAADVTSAQAMLHLMRALLIAPAGAALQASRCPTRAQRDSDAPKVLLVDDVADNRSILHRRLARRGMQVVEADCGQRAMAAIDQGGYDLVLLDVMMPGVSGLEVLTWIRSRYSSFELPVIMVTGMTFSSDVATALRMGADDYLTKPLDFEAAMVAIERVLDRRSTSVAG